MFAQRGCSKLISRRGGATSSLRVGTASLGATNLGIRLRVDSAAFERHFHDDDFGAGVEMSAGFSHSTASTASLVGTVKSTKKRSGMRGLQSIGSSQLQSATPSSMEGVPSIVSTASSGSAVATTRDSDEAIQPNSRQKTLQALQEGTLVASDTDEFAPPPHESDRISRRFADGIHRVEAVLERTPHLLAMPPARLALQQDLLRTHSCHSVLELCSEAEVGEMDAVNIATAIHRLAKLSSSVYQRSLVTVHPHFLGLLGAVPQKIDEFNGRGLANVLWAAVQLECSPNWLPKLLSACLDRQNEFSARDLSATLSCLAKASDLKHLSEYIDLKAAVLANLAPRLQELKTSTDLACAITAYARLAHREEPVFNQVAHMTTEIISEFESADVASVLWAFANLNLAHPEMFGCIKDWLEKNIDNCTPREIVQIAWAFSRAEQGDEDMFNDVLAPAIQKKMLEFNAPRDLCTLVWAYSNVGVKNETLFNDLAHVLSPKVKFMNAHDVASIVVAFSSIEYGHRRLFNALVKHTRSIAHTFSPLQLARSVYGFGVAGIEDEPLYRTLCENIMKQRQHLHAKNIVEILTGLTEAEYTPLKVTRAMLKDACEVSRWLGGEDAIQLLHCLTRLPAKIQHAVELETIALRLVGIVRRRGQGWWRFSPQDMADLVEAIGALKVHDPVILENICRQFPRLVRDAKCTTTLFLRLWGSMAELPVLDRGLIRHNVQRRRNFLATLEEKLSDAIHGLVTERGSLRSLSLLLYACVRLGYDGESVGTLTSFVHQSSVDETNCAKRGMVHEPWWPVFIWSLAEAQVESDFATAEARKWVEEKFGPSPSELSEELQPNNLLHMAWACVVLDVPLPETYIDALSGMFEKLATTDADARRLLQHIALDLKLSAKGRDAIRAKPDKTNPGMAWFLSLLQGGSDKAEDFGMGAASLAQLEKKEQILEERQEDSWIARALSASTIPHVGSVLLGGAHRVSAVLPQTRQAIVVLTAEDMTTPSRSMCGSAFLRRRHLEALGWRCEEVTFHEVKTAESAGSLADFLCVKLNFADA